ncbi:hypothetical protein [Pedococcus sp. P5_B7]
MAMGSPTPASAPTGGQPQALAPVAVRDAVVVQTSFLALRRTVAAVQADCAEVAETLEALEDALAMVTQGGSGGGAQAMSGFGLVGLPIVGAMRAVKGLASQYVKQQTGVPLSTWAAFVTSASGEFQAYLAELERISDLAEKQRQSPDGAIDATRIRKDLKVLADVRWRTAAWKTVLGRVAQLGQVVDAILQVDVHAVEAEAGTATGEAAPPEAPAGLTGLTGLGGTLQRRIKDVQHRTTDRSSDLREWVMRPFLDVRDRVRQLPAQVARLAQEVGLLELFLELETAELSGLAGHLAADETRIVRLRVAASVLLPELVHDLARARSAVADLEAYQRRLDVGREQGTVGTVAHERLSTEYGRDLEAARLLLTDLETQKEVWRRDGPQILRACEEWTTVELDVLAARRVAEQADKAADRRALLERERSRLEEARALLASL